MKKDMLYYKYFLKIYSNKIFSKLKMPKVFDVDEVLANRGIKSANEINKNIYDKIISGEPFFVGRIGGTECAVIVDYLRTIHFRREGYIREKLIKQLNVYSGFFPANVEEAVKFAKLMLDSCSEVDILARWWGGFENYIIEKYACDTKLTNLPDIEPWQNGVSIPWSEALKGKKVLVIHPFEKSIKQQFKKHNKIFEGTNILPEFNLITVKAVQTIAGQYDSRFETWFDALEHMYNQAMEKDFDIAIIGCGAYGFPLAAKIKKAGKQAIHLAGATQILFGIKGKRWESEQNFGYLHPYFNSEWIYPLEEDIPQNAKAVEDGCYWR